MTSKNYEIKKQVIGEDSDLEKSCRILNRVIEWGRDGNTNEADQRHAREMSKELDLERANHIAQGVKEARWRAKVNRGKLRYRTNGTTQVTGATGSG